MTLMPTVDPTSLSFHYSCKSFQAILGDLSGDATEQAYVVVKMVLNIPEVQFTILTKFGGNI